MTALALIAGRFVGEPRIRPTKTGNRVAFFTIKVAAAGGVEWWQVTTFDDEAIRQIADLFDGAPIATTGEMAFEEWEREGKRGINRKLTADAVLIGRSKKKSTPRPVKPKPTGREIAGRSWADPRLNDDIPF